MATTLTPTASAQDLSAAPNRETWPRSAWTDAALLAGITLVAAALRFYGISARTFWFDETVSAQISRLTWSQFIQALWNREANMGFYYTLLHFWLLIGHTEGFIRAFSAIFSVATIPVVYALGVRLFNRKTGFVAAWLLSINVFHVCYAQTARGYALVVFLLSVATLLLVKNLQEPGSPRWGTYTSVCVLAVYTHFFAGLVVLAHCVSLLFLKKSDVPWRGFLRGMARFSFLMIPIAIFIARVGPGPLNWIQKPRPDTVLNFLIDMAGNGGIRLLALEAIPILVAGFWGAAMYRTEGRTLKTWSFALMWAWLMVPILILLAVSEKQPVFLARYLNLTLPPFVLLLSAGITRMRPAFLGWIFAALISVASIAGTLTYYRDGFEAGIDDWRSATSFIFQHAHPGDDIFFYLNFGRIPFEYYKSITSPTPLWPKSLDAPDDEALSYRDFQFKYLGESLANSRVAGDRVWLVFLYYTDPDGKPNRSATICRAVFGNGRRLVEEKEFSGVRVLLFSRDKQGETSTSIIKP
jgi:mannosyltransferase